MSILLFVILVGCKNKNFICCKENSYEESNQRLLSSFKVDSGIIAMTHFDSLTGTYAPDFSFGIHHTYLGNEHYIVYLLGNRDSLLLINPFDALDVKKCAINKNLKKRIPYNVYIDVDVLHCLGDEEYIYKQLKIDSTVNEKLSVDLKAKLSKNKREFIYSSLVVDKSLAFKNPYLIIPFGDYKAKNNCGSHSWKIIDITTKEVTKALDFPEKYRQCDLKYPDCIIQPGDSSFIYTVFLKFDKIFKIDVHNGKIAVSTQDSVFPNRFLCYDHDLDHNMAYKDKYERLDENNENLIFNPVTKQLFLIKRLRKESKNQGIQCAILIFDSNLNHCGTYYTSTGLYPRLSFWYEKGLVIIDSSFSKGFYYAFHK